MEDKHSQSSLAYKKLMLINYDDREKLNQVASLLLINSFIPPEGVGAGTVATGTINNISQIVSTSASVGLTKVVNKLIGDKELNVNVKYENYNYKEAVLNPTNPRDRAVEWEADVVNEFRGNAAQQEIMGMRTAASGPALYLARPLKITDPGCLTCHSTPDKAPAAMVTQYGPNNGFGWKLNETIGAQVVSVPMSLPIANADRAFVTFMASLSGVFIVLFIILNLMLSFLIVKPITEMSEAANEISTGNMDIPEFADKGKDEMALLAKSFNRMRRSLQKAISLIDP
jgi:protein-histidine pros-kinase